MRYKTRRITYEDTDYDFSKLITIAGTAKMLDVGIGKVRSMIDRGVLTVILDTEAHATQQGARLLLRSEIEALAIRKASNDLL